MAQSFIYGVQRNKGVVSVTAANERGAQQLAQKFYVRHVPFYNLYDTLADVVVVAEPALQLGPGRADLNAGYLRPTMTVMDLSAMPGDTPMLEEARSRGCKVVEPADVYHLLIQTQFESLTGKQFPCEVWDELAASET